MKLAWILGAGLATLVICSGCGDDTSATNSSGATSSNGGGGATSNGGNPNGGSPGGGGNGGDPGVGGGTPNCRDDPNDSACVACGKNNCCAELAACEASGTCAPCIVCIQDAADPSTCVGAGCDVQDPTTAALVACSADHCNTECFNGASVCDPAKNDTPCTTCVKAMDAGDPPGCCDELTVCSTDPECVQCLGCIQAAADPTACVGDPCQLGDPETAAFLGCAQDNCAVCSGG
jgi:hypothetical protein